MPFPGRSHNNNGGGGLSDDEGDLNDTTVLNFCSTSPQDEDDFKHLKDPSRFDVLATASLFDHGQDDDEEDDEDLEDEGAGLKKCRSFTDVKANSTRCSNG